MFRAHKGSGILTAAEALRWLTQHKGLPQAEAEQTLASLQSTHHISIVGQSQVDLSTSLSHQQLSRLQLQLVQTALPPKFGQPLNMHYRW